MKTEGEHVEDHHQYSCRQDLRAPLLVLVGAALTISSPRADLADALDIRERDMAGSAQLNLQALREAVALAWPLLPCDARAGTGLRQGRL